VGTIIAMMLPYAAATKVAWLVLFFAWYLLGIPFGPK
jgi:aminobenzoyl-glutamate transport protein